MSGGEPTNKFTVSVTYNGLTKDLEVNRHQAMQAVLQHAIGLFEVTEQPGTMALFDTSNNEYSDLNASVEAVGLQPGQLVVLRPRVARGG
jgi:hypothetical protein